MRKQEAIDMLGGTAKKVAEAMGYKVPQSVYLWPDPLSQSVADKVRGAALRLKESKKAKKPTAVLPE